MRKEKRMEGGMEGGWGDGGDGGEAHLYSSVDCRVSAVVVHLVGKTLGFIYKNHAAWFMPLLQSIITTTNMMNQMV